MNQSDEIAVAALTVYQRCGVLARAAVAGFALVCWSGFPAQAGGADGAVAFRKDVQPILSEFCYSCHGEGQATAKVAFDKFGTDRELLSSRDLWWRALKQVRAGLMPPKGEPRPSVEQIKKLEDWIKAAVFEANPQDPDPGRVTVRRLNRIEYRNTIRDLLDVNFDTTAEFPADDTGHGFDNIGDVLTLSPLLLEKYLAAAKSIVGQAVPTIAGVPPERTVDGKRFRKVTETGEQKDLGKGELYLSYYEPAALAARYTAPHAGRYQLGLHVSAHEKFVDGVFDYNKCRLTFKADGETLLEQEFSRQDGKSFHFEFDREWQSGEHDLAVELTPLTPDEKQTRTLTLRLISATVRGPMSKEHWVRPKNYEKFFPREVPEGLAERRHYARDILEPFTMKAFRRPVDPETVDRLVALAESIYTAGGQTFESGVAWAMTAVLASPRFLFREEQADPASSGAHPYIDQYSLASRLSYFFWSSMPDDELFRLAGEQKLRDNLAAQVKRLQADSKAKDLTRHFIGQWLQARDIDSVNINAFAVMSRDEKADPEMDRRRTRFRELRQKPFESLTAEEKAELDEARKAFSSGFRRFSQYELNGDLRRAMRQETEMLFDYIVREDRSLLEMIDCDYTFLNERLAKHYGIDTVKGNDMRRVDLPPDSPRGGILTQGTVLAITSNPDRTSPVKRGLFILDNLLGSPPPPPPPDVPTLEDSAKKISGRTPTLREALEVHRSDALCNSCHNRMDPLGLALENFNALGIFRESRPDRPIDVSGTLLTGESFESVRQLKHILATERRLDFYRCLTEKLLTYALGRGLDYNDVVTVDGIVDRLERENGRPSALLSGIIESAPFQKRRQQVAVEGPSAPAGQD